MLGVCGAAVSLAAQSLFSSQPLQVFIEFGEPEPNSSIEYQNKNLIAMASNLIAFWRSKSVEEFHRISAWIVWIDLELFAFVCRTWKFSSWRSNEYIGETPGKTMRFSLQAILKRRIIQQNCQSSEEAHISHDLHFLGPLLNTTASIYAS